MKVSCIGDEAMFDIAGVEHIVEVEIRDDGNVLWVNIDGLCKLRVKTDGKPIVVKDNRLK